MSDIPHSYTNAQASAPRYTLPDTFDIGHRSVGLLIHPHQLRGHLSMLHAFHNLRVIVESDDVTQFPVDVCAMDPEKRWSWFVNIAVERFERWCRSLGDWCSANPELALPPIDVLMVWHTYLLNPIWYAEDTAHISTLGYLPVLTEYFATNVASPGLLITSEPHPDRIHNWEHRTDTPYDPFGAVDSLSYKELQCPHCEHRMIPDDHTAFLGPNGSGYAQGNFVASCSSCRKTTNKKLLGLHKFANDIVKSPGFLSGTLHTPNEQHDTGSATVIKQRVMTAIKLPASNTLTIQEVMKQLKFSPALLTESLTGQFHRRMYAQMRILSAYTDDRPFSVELVGAVLRQASFVSKMAGLGWTDPEFFADEEEMVVLQHCVARYHAFLGLMADAPGSLSVPTLDIDLAWHTHQLRGNYYHTECKRVVGRYVDHDDKIEEDSLAKGFDITCRAWTDRYGLPYTYCGCPLPGTTLGQRLRNALSLHRRRTTKEVDILRPPPDAAAGTHASDHNAVYLIHHQKASEHAREQRRQEAERRRRREALDAKHEDEDEPAALRYNRSQTRAHGLAFLYPVPMRARVASCVTVPSVVENGACATVSILLAYSLPFLRGEVY
ncbi:hypothetical protein HD554DRAFT_2028306 [Boletus coccyginus]|nr:hypothetical protein HD554DRAFT_2028306 [Boletus coccyginus]